MADNKQKILDIKVNYQKAVKSIAEYQTKIDEAKEAEKELKKQLEKGEITRQQYNEEMAASKAYIDDCKDSIRVLSRTVQNQLKIEKEQEGSLASLRAELSNLTRQYDAMSEAERTSASGKELEDKINSITDTIKGAEEETQRYYRNVGNYAESLSPLFDRLEQKLARQKKQYEDLIRTQGEHTKAAKKAKKAIKDTQLELDLFGDAAEKADESMMGFIATGVGLDASLIKMFKSMGTFAQGARMAGVAVKGLSMQIVALMANPVVAFLSVLATALLAVSKGITSSETNTNRWRIAMAPFNRLLNSGINLIQQFAGWILNAVESGGKMLGWLNKMADRLPYIGKSLKEQNDQIKIGIELEKEKIAIEQQSRKDEVQNAKDALAVSELRTKAKEIEKYSAEERLQFVKQANKLEEEQAKRNVELAERKLKALQIESEWADNDAATNEELARLEAEVYNKRKEYFEKTRELLEQENTLKQEAKAKEKEKQDAAKAAADKAGEIRQKELDEVRAAEDALLALVTDEREKQRIEIGRNYDRQIEDLRTKLQAEKDLTAKAREAINTQIVTLQQQKVDAMKKLSDEELQTELANKQKLIELQLAAVKEGTDAEYQLKMQQLQTQQEAELANTELTEQMKLAIKAKYNAQMDELSAAREQETYNRQQEAMKTRFETEIAEAYGNEEEILRIKMEQKKAELDALQQFEGESQEEFNLRRLEAQNAFVESQEALSQKEIQIEEAKYDAMEQVTGGLITLTQQIGESDRGFALASKVLALAEIAINSGKAISKMVAAESGKGILGLGTMAAGIATILSNIANAIKIVKGAKFAQGGYVSGPGTGTSDSIPAHLSNGESVMTAQATSMFAPILSSFNQIGGGIPINVTATSNQQIGEEMLARAVAKGVQMSPAPVVSVEEINRVQKRLQVLERLSTL